MNLKIKDIDPERMMIRVERGKGGKDRYTILSKTCSRNYAFIGNVTGLLSGYFPTEPRMAL